MMLVSFFFMENPSQKSTILCFQNLIRWASKYHPPEGQINTLRLLGNEIGEG